MSIWPVYVSNLLLQNQIHPKCNVSKKVLLSFMVLLVYWVLICDWAPVAAVPGMSWRFVWAERNTTDWERMLPFTDCNSGAAKSRAATHGLSLQLGFPQHCCWFSKGRRQKLPGQLSTTASLPPSSTGQSIQILRREVINFPSQWWESYKITLQKERGKGKCFHTVFGKYNEPHCNYETDRRTFNAQTLKIFASESMTQL